MTRRKFLAAMLALPVAMALPFKPKPPLFTSPTYVMPKGARITAATLTFHGKPIIWDPDTYSGMVFMVDDQKWGVCQKLSDLPGASTVTLKRI